MNKQQHAPGPWTQRPYDVTQVCAQVQASSGDDPRPYYEVARCVRAEDARLIAAAPELLAMVERLAPADCVAATEGEEGCDHCLAESLIARARGEV